MERKPSLLKLLRSVRGRGHDVAKPHLDQQMGAQNDGDWVA